MKSLHEALALTNTLLTLTSITCAIAGVRAIRKKQLERHARLMTAAVLIATLFMITFVTRIVLYGVTTYHTGQGILKVFYLLLAGTHDAMAVISCPSVLVALFLGHKGHFRLHRQIAEVAYPVWLYSAFSGVVLYFLLYVF